MKGADFASGTESSWDWIKDALGQHAGKSRPDSVIMASTAWQGGAGDRLCVCVCGGGVAGELWFNVPGSAILAALVLMMC